MEMLCSQLIREHRVRLYSVVHRYVLEKSHGGVVKMRVVGVHCHRFRFTTVAQP